MGSNNRRMGVVGLTFAVNRETTLPDRETIVPVHETFIVSRGLTDPGRITFEVRRPGTRERRAGTLP
jgi:hypothetical protein